MKAIFNVNYNSTDGTNIHELLWELWNSQVVFDIDSTKLMPQTEYEKKIAPLNSLQTSDKKIKGWWFQ
jgi:hypothetical protein